MSHSANMNYLSNNLPINNKYPENNNYLDNNYLDNNYPENINYPLNINNNAYKSCSNDEYDALESNVPYISKNRPYSPKSKLYHSVNNWDLLAFVVVTTLLVLLLFTTTQIKNQKNIISDYYSDNSLDNSPASIYQNYNEKMNDAEFYIHPEINNNRNLHEQHQVGLGIFEDLNEGSNYYSEYYKARLQELCDLSLKKASNNHSKK